MLQLTKQTTQAIAYAQDALTFLFLDHIAAKEIRAIYLFVRTLFGRREPGYKDAGIVSKSGGRRLSSNVFLVPLTQRPAITQTLDAHKTPYTMMDIVQYST